MKKFKTEVFNNIIDKYVYEVIPDYSYDFLKKDFNYYIDCLDNESIEILYNNLINKETKKYNKENIIEDLFDYINLLSMFINDNKYININNNDMCRIIPYFLLYINNEYQNRFNKEKALSSKESIKNRTNNVFKSVIKESMNKGNSIVL